MSGQRGSQPQDQMLSKLEALRAETSELKAQIVRLSAETQATATEGQRQAETLRLETIKAFARDIMIVGDKLALVVKDAPKESSHQSLQSLIFGLELTESELLKASSRHGLCRLEPQAGEAFDAHQHLALIGQAHPGARIVGVVAPGYTFQGEVLRPATVLLENVDEDAEATLRWLNELSVPFEPAPVRDDPKIPDRYVSVGLPFEEKPFDREGVAALLNQLNIHQPKPVEPTTAQRRRRVNVRGAVPLRRPSPATLSKARAVVATVVGAAALSIIVLPISSSRVQQDDIPNTRTQDLASTTAPRALSLRPKALVEGEVSPDGMATVVGTRGTRSSSARSPGRALAALSAAPAARPFFETVAPQAKVESEPVIIAANVAPEPTSSRLDGPAPRHLVLAQARQSNTELDGLLGGVQLTTGPTRVSLERESKQRLAATLSTNVLR